MPRTGNTIGAAILALATSIPALAQQRFVPLADDVQQSLLPSGIFHQDIDLRARLAHVFDDPNGSKGVHLVGKVDVAVGDHGHRLRAREAAAWLTTRQGEQGYVTSCDLLLWGNAEIREIGGTLTTGAVLFVSMSTYGDVSVHADDVSRRQAHDAEVIEQGRALRELLAQRPESRTTGMTALRIFRPPAASPKERQARQWINFRAQGEWLVKAVGDRQIAVANGGIYLSRSVPGSDEYLELRADSAVVFFPAGSAAPDDDSRDPLAEDSPLGRQRDPDEESDDAAADSGVPMFDASGAGMTRIEAVYLEGDVVVTQREYGIRASRIYYDFASDRALILDAVVRTDLPGRNVPLYLRADEIRQLSTRAYSADKAMLTTSEFHTPHYHIGADRIEITDRTPPDPAGAQRGITAGSFRIEHATLNVANIPVAYWPFIYGSVDSSESSIQSLRFGFSDDFGAEIETDWDLFNLLGLQRPDGFDSTLSLDYFSRRGPAVGADVDYLQDEYFGLIKSYLLLNDDGDDFLGRQREEVGRDGSRGRFLARHRHYLEDDWQLSTEFSYISDRGFLEEFFETEFDLEKDQETLIHLKRQRANWAFVATAQWRLLDWLTQVERLPDFSYFRIGEPTPVGTLMSENRLGLVRFRAGDKTFRELLRDGHEESSGVTARADSRQELEHPFDVGPVRLVPFASIRGSAWEETLDGGSAQRIFATYGVRGSMYLSRVYPDTRSSLFDLNGIRHIVKPEFTVWMSHTNVDSDELFEFDRSVEGIDEVDGATIGVRQRWQTKRGHGDNRRNVDVFTLDIELGVFNDAQNEFRSNGFASVTRPENSIARNFVNTSAIWRVNDRTALVGESNFDVDDAEFDILNLSMAVDRTPRFSYLLGYRYIGETESNLLLYGANYQLTEKHTLALREAFDLDRGRTLDFTVGLIRRFPRWFTALSFQLDEAEDDFGVSLSIWPQGFSRAKLGSSRFTGLGETTALTPD